MPGVFKTRGQEPCEGFEKTSSGCRGDPFFPSPIRKNLQHRQEAKEIKIFKNHSSKIQYFLWAKAFELF